MSLGQAVSTCFSKYATFSGRARRSEFWWWVLFVVLVDIVATIIDSVLGFHIYTMTSSNGTVATASVGYVGAIAGLALLLPSVAVTFRRLHDTDRSGWWWFASVICGCVGLVVLVFCMLQGTPGTNRYGDAPA